jgi:hypothetical protein
MNRIRNRWRLAWLKARQDAAIKMAGLAGVMTLQAELSLRVFRNDGTIEDLGVVSRKSVTDAFVAFLVDQLQTESSEFGDFKYHDMGDDDTAEADGDTALISSVENRVSGTQVEGATANIYKSVGTIAATAGRAIVEHGLFSQSSGGTLMDRSVFSVVNLDSGESIEFTYQLTNAAGG